jgi:restriction system protein
MRVARAADRASRAAVRAHAAQLREEDRLAKFRLRQAIQDHLAARQAETEDQNNQVDAAVQCLETILMSGLSRNPAVPLASLYRQADSADMPDSLKTLAEVSRATFEPAPLGFFAALVPGAQRKHAAAIADGAERYRAAMVASLRLVELREEAMAELEANAAAHNREIDAWKENLHAGDPEAVKVFAELVLEHSPYPDGFPQEARVGFAGESKQLVVDLRAPILADIVPVMDRYRYIKAQDVVAGTRMAEKVRQALYSSAIAQTTLRTLYELFTADQEHHIEIIVLNIYVVATDPATGQVVRPYIISTRVARDEFEGLQLAAVDPQACLKRLKSQVSRSASELIPVKPIVDINMADPRFIDEQDILSTLDSRPNLMELSPGEFESLITNLFQAMGLDTRLTQASRDGGVDCVAFDPRPVLGGKVVVQAKRYKNTVGVSAVRDLFGTMLNEGASKGILVTTSGFGKAAYTFANEKPIELLTGSNLLYLLHEHAGVDAKIEPPDDWVDPVLDIGD